MNHDPLLVVEDLAVEFHGDHGRVLAVDHVSFTLDRGEVLGLVGESGSGKSTIALALLGLLPRAGRVVCGTAHFDGEELLSLPESRRRRLRGARIATVFQDPMTSLTPWLTIRTQLTEQLAAHGRLTADADGQCRGLLAAVGLPEPAIALAKYPHEFSGGQRQRIMIAMALSCDPDLIVADEPTTALDVTVQAQILALLQRLQRGRRLALLLVTHDMGVVAGLCDRVAVLRDGRMVETATTEALFANPQHPYTQDLLAVVPRLPGPPVATPGGEP
jgi:ABC-type dipeptide/oligopeptide/nickel transport system ATPase component